MRLLRKLVLYLIVGIIAIAPAALAGLLVNPPTRRVATGVIVLLLFFGTPVWWHIVSKSKRVEGLLEWLDPDSEPETVAQLFERTNRDNDDAGRVQ